MKRMALVYLMAMLIAWVGFGCSLGSSGASPEAKVTNVPKPERPEVILSTTTSTYDTGLLDVLLPKFEKKTGYKVKPIAVGTGQALAMGEKGDTDVLLVHDPASEQKLVDAGIAINRKQLMYNYYAIVGPASDPAGIKGGKDVVTAFKKIASSGALWVSRGDDSGTHKMEKRLWEKAGVTPSGSWYQETGQGMGNTLKIASEKKMYTLTDRGTYLALKKGLELQVLVEGDPLLLNLYSVMQVNPARFPRVNAQGGKAFVDFMVAPETQAIIKNLGVDKFKEPLFLLGDGK